MDCCYDAGRLAGLQMSDDVPAFCNYTAGYLAIGVTADCPDAAQELVVYCDPYPRLSVDAGLGAGRG